MLRAAAVFSDHMVLQRNKKICVFGQGVIGRKISVTLGEDTAMARCRDGRWMAYLPEREAVEGLGMDDKILLVCNKGKQAYLVQNRLKFYGYTNTKVLEGGAAATEVE